MKGMRWFLTICGSPACGWPVLEALRQLAASAV
jgi:hypothetical protein